MTTMEAEAQPKFLTPKEVAQRWRLTPAAIFKFARTGELPATRIGRSVRFRLEDVERVEQDGRPAPSDKRQTTRGVATECTRWEAR